MEIELKKKGEERQSAGFESYQTSPRQRQEASAQLFDQRVNFTKNLRKRLRDFKGKK